MIGGLPIPEPPSVGFRYVQSDLPVMRRRSTPCPASGITSAGWVHWRSPWVSVRRWHRCRRLRSRTPRGQAGPQDRMHPIHQPPHQVFRTPRSVQGSVLDPQPLCRRHRAGLLRRIRPVSRRPMLATRGRCPTRWARLGQRSALIQTRVNQQFRRALLADRSRVLPVGIVWTRPTRRARVGPVERRARAGPNHKT